MRMPAWASLLPGRPVRLGGSLACRVDRPSSPACAALPLVTCLATRTARSTSSACASATSTSFSPEGSKGGGQGASQGLKVSTPHKGLCRAVDIKACLGCWAVDQRKTQIDAWHGGRLGLAAGTIADGWVSTAGVLGAADFSPLRQLEATAAVGVWISCCCFARELS